MLRIAFSSPTNGSNPVLQGILALVSLQLQGSLKSFQYKRLVLLSLTPPDQLIKKDLLLRNLMGLMLLYQHEVVRAPYAEFAMAD